MLALSLQQPYADLIVERAYEDDSHKVLKSVENRSRPLPRTFSTPQRIYVHASLGFYDVTLSEIKANMTISQWLRLKDRLHSIYRAWESYRYDPQFRQKLGYFGCLIGEVTVTKQIRKHSDNPKSSLNVIGGIFSMGDLAAEIEDLHKTTPEYFSPWFFGPFGYVLTDPVRYGKPIPCKGMPGFFEPDIPVDAK